MRVPDFIVGRMFEPLWDTYEGSIRLKTLKELRESQFLPAEVLLDLQGRRLGEMVRHAGRTSPFFRRRFAECGLDPESVKSIDDLKQLPLLTKKDIRENLADILSTSYNPSRLVPAKTGGSTGVALDIFCDPRGIQKRNAAALRSDEWSGWRLGQPLASVWGNPPVARTLKSRIRTTFKDRRIYLDTMRIDSEAIDEFLVQWERMKPGMLYGHAHSIFLFAEELLARGIRLPINGIVATSMMLIDPERKVIEQAFGTPVTNRYGCEEVSLVACECEVHRGMHLNAEHVIVEFLRDDGSDCEPGEDGRLVITELVNFGMPMIRYEVGDRGIPSSRRCECGRGLPLMESITGRTADFLVAEGGFRVAGISIIENSLTRIPGLGQMQIIQDQALRLQVNVVPGQGYGEGTEAELTRSLQDMLGKGMAVHLNRVETIPQEESGKYRFTICRI